MLTKNRSVLLKQTGLRWVREGPSDAPWRDTFSDKEALTWFLEAHLPFVPVDCGHRAVPDRPEPTEDELAAALEAAADHFHSTEHVNEVSNVEALDLRTLYKHFKTVVPWLEHFPRLTTRGLAVALSLMALDPSTCTKIPGTTWQRPHAEQLAFDALAEEVPGVRGCLDTKTLLKVIDNEIHERLMIQAVANVRPAEVSWTRLDQAGDLYFVSQDTLDKASELCKQLADESGLLLEAVRKACAIESLVEEEPKIGFFVEELLGSRD